MDDAQIAALKEELRRDLEALTRVEAMMAAKNGAMPAKKPDERQTPLPMKPTLVAPVETDDDDLDDLDGTSLRGAIYRAISAEPNLRWTTQKVFSKLKDENYRFQAKKPLISVGQALKALVKQEKIRITRRGTGSAPNIYKGVEKPSDSISQSEQSLAG